MPTKDIESMLLPWHLNSRPKQRVQRRAGVRWVRTQTLPVARDPKRVTPCTYVALAQLAARAPDVKNAEGGGSTEWVVDETRKPRNAVKEEQDSMAICEVIRFDGEDAECSVKLSGYELPSVSLPAWVLRAKNLERGDRFIWTLRDSMRIQPDDIDPHLSKAVPELSEQQKAELEALYEDSRQRETDGEVWD